jgi:hypothetical protein
MFLFPISFIEGIESSISDCNTPTLRNEFTATLAGCRKTIALDNTALRSSSKCPFITHKLRFFVGFCLVLPAAHDVF